MPRLDAAPAATQLRIALARKIYLLLGFARVGSRAVRETCMGWLAALVMLIWGGVALAQPLQLEGNLVQGGLVRGLVPPGSEVSFAGRALRVDRDGRFLLGFGRDEASGAALTVRYPDGSQEVRRLEIARHDYAIERIDGLPPREVAPSAEDLVRIEADARLIGAARQRDSGESGVAEKFVWPVVGRISGVYGSQRILNGEPRRPHRGVDIAAPEGTPIGAMADGVVSLVAPAMYFTGGTVMIDHGYGLHSIYAHMSEVTVTTGQAVRRGEPIGRVGATGRATGPHLHWGVFWFERALDPALLVGPMPQA
jgi:murein DD-endopeptidase MepM/ murein hydrolase activator NlpD